MARGVTIVRPSLAFPRKISQTDALRVVAFLLVDDVVKLVANCTMSRFLCRIENDKDGTRWRE